MDRHIAALLAMTSGGAPLTVMGSGALLAMMGNGAQAWIAASLRAIFRVALTSRRNPLHGSR